MTTNEQDVTVDALYLLLMETAEQFDAAETDDTRAELVKTAESAYKQIFEQVQPLTEPQQKRIERTILYLRGEHEQAEL